MLIPKEPPRQSLIALNMNEDNSSNKLKFSSQSQWKLLKMRTAGMSSEFFFFLFFFLLKDKAAFIKWVWLIFDERKINTEKHVYNLKGDWLEWNIPMCQFDLFKAK